MDGQHSIVLVTDRLRLRPFRKDDWSAVHEYAVDPEISQFQEWGPNSVKDTKSFVENCIAAADNPAISGYFFSIARLTDDVHIGGCRIAISRDVPNEASIGYTIGPKNWNHGYATEAARAMIKFGFVDLEMTRITANCDANNAASWRVMQKAGMRLAHTQINARYFKYEWHDWLEYAITVEEWLADCYRPKSPYQLP